MSIPAVLSLHLTRNYESWEPSYSATRFQTLSYAECEHLWSYGGKLVLLTRNLLNVAARSSSVVFSRRAKTVITHLKFLSIVSVPFSLVDLTSIAQKIGRSFLINDKEGLAMSSLSFTMTSADILDSVSTFVNALLAVLETPSSEILSSIGLPLGFLISSIGTVSRTVQIAKACNLYQNIRPSSFLGVDCKNKDSFKKELEERLGIQRQEMDQTSLDELERLKEKKKAIISRLIPKDAMETFEKLFLLLDVKSGELLTDQELEEAFESLEAIQCHLEKKVKVDSIGILANLIVIFALSLFTVGVISYLPFLLLAIAFLIRIMSLVYQDQKI